MPTIGDHVIFVDSYRVRHHAIITDVHDGGQPEKFPKPAVNLVYVSGDSTQTDQYGRQTIHAASVVHEESNSAKAYCWVEGDAPGRPETPSEILGSKACGGG